MRSTPAGADDAQRREHLEHVLVGDAGDELGRVEVGLGAQARERVPDVGRERIGLERGEHLGGGGLDVAVEVHHVRPGDPGRGHRRREPRSVGSATPAEQRAGRVDLAELQVRGRVEQVAEVGARRVLADDLGPDR